MPFLKRILVLRLIVFLSLLVVSGCVSSKDVAHIEIPQPKIEGVYHKVMKGETLWRITKAYAIDIEDIIEFNNIPDAAQIEKNQLIFIPGAKKTIEIVLDKVEDTNDFVWPVRGKVITYFHQRKNNILSNGIDILTKEGQVITAARTGRVIFVDYLVGYGETIILDHSDGLYSVYANNAKVLVKLDQLVKKNNPISYPAVRKDLAYLHFEIRKNAQEDNPLHYLP